jgi:septal ring factor EnvC (AmiA/AmiB activator)
MSILVGIIVAMGAVIAFLFGKKNDAEALTQNVAVKEQVANIDTTIAQDQGTLQSEAQKRAALQQSLEQTNKNVESVKDLSDFLNRDLSKGPDDK